MSQGCLRRANLAGIASLRQLPDYVIRPQHVAFVEGTVDDIKFKEKGVVLGIVIVDEKRVVNVT